MKHFKLNIERKPIPVADLCITGIPKEEYISVVKAFNSTLNDKQKEGLKQSWNNAFGSNASTPNGVAVLEANMDFQPITVNPSDAQLLETRKFNIKDTFA